MLHHHLDARLTEKNKEGITYGEVFDLLEKYYSLGRTFDSFFIQHFDKYRISKDIRDKITKLKKGTLVNKLNSYPKKRMWVCPSTLTKLQNKEGFQVLNRIGLLLKEKVL